MQSTKFQSSPVKDGRRVLGEKTANACLSPSRNRNVDAFLTGSPVKRNLFEAPSPKKLLLPPCRAGQKRTIGQVEGNEVNKPGSQGSLQLAPPRNEEQLEESSTQSTVRNDDQTPNPDATESDVPTGNQQHAQNVASIPNKPGRPSDETRSKTTVPEDSEARRLFIQEKATLLRNRIQSAMRHVRDRQFERRLSELEAHSHKFPRLSFLATTPMREPVVRQATTPPSAKTPRLQPALELKPASSQTSSNPSGLSSPPLSAGNPGDEQMKTPTQRGARHQSGASGSPLQLSSPPATVLRVAHDRHRTGETRSERGYSYAAEKLAASSQKGDAVDGLLKLMTVDKHECLDTRTG